MLCQSECNLLFVYVPALRNVTGGGLVGLNKSTNSVTCFMEDPLTFLTSVIECEHDCRNMINYGYDYLVQSLPSLFVVPAERGNDVCIRETVLTGHARAAVSFTPFRPGP